MEKLLSNNIIILFVSRKLKKLFLFSAAVLLIGCVALYNALAMYESARPLSLGLLFEECYPGGSCRILAVGTESEARRAGLRPGDKIREIDGAPAELESIFKGEAFFNSRAEQPQILLIENEAGRRAVELAPRRAANEHLSALAAMWAAKWLSVAVAALLFIRRIKSSVAWLAALMLLCGSLGSDYPLHAPGVGGALREIFPSWFGAFVFLISAFAHASGGFAFPLLWMFFPKPLSITRRRWLLVLLVLPYLPFAANEILLAASAWFRQPLFLFPHTEWVTIAAGWSVLVGAAAMLVNYLTNDSADARRRLRTIGAALLILGVLWTLEASATIFGLPAAREQASWGVRFSFVVLPFALGWAVLRHRAFGMRVFVRRAVRYALARNTLLALALVPALFFAYFAGRDGWRAFAGERLWILIFIIISALALASFRNTLLEWIDRRFFLEARQAQGVLLALGARLRRCQNFGEIEAAVSSVIAEAYRPSRLWVRIINEKSGGAASTFSQEFSTILPKEILTNKILREPLQIKGRQTDAAFAEEEEWAIPINAVDGELLGLILVGERASGEPFEKNDIALLAAIAQAAATQLEALKLADEALAERNRRAEIEAIFARERLRLSRELHDGIGSTFTNIAHLSEEERAENLQKIETLAREGIGELRQMLWATYVEDRTWTETAAHLRRYAIETCRAAHLKLDFAVSAPNFKESNEIPDPLSPAQRLALLRCLQQSLANTIAHAKAKKVCVQIKLDSQSVSITISDDGCGFDVENAPGRRAGHYGLTSLRQRAEEIGGVFTVESAPGKGTTARMQLPFIKK